MAREPDDTVKIRDAMRRRGVEYLVIGKMAAILQGFSDTTQDTDVFVESTPENNARLLEALNDLGFDLDEELAATIRTGGDWVQLRGPVDIDIVVHPTPAGGGMRGRVGRIAIPLLPRITLVTATARPLQGIRIGVEYEALRVQVCFHVARAPVNAL